MIELTALLADADARTVDDLAAWTPRQHADLARRLEVMTAWLEALRFKFDVALTQAYGAHIAQTRADAVDALEVIHHIGGDVCLRVEVAQHVVWDQAPLAMIAARIHAAGERVEEFIDISYCIPEARFWSWPPSLQAQFARARTVIRERPTYRVWAIEDA